MTFIKIEHAAKLFTRPIGKASVRNGILTVTVPKKAHIFRKGANDIERIADAKIHQGTHGDTSFIRKLTDGLDAGAQKDVFDSLIHMPEHEIEEHIYNSIWF